MEETGQSEEALERKVKGQRWYGGLAVSLYGVTSGKGGTGTEEYQMPVGHNLWRARCASYLMYLER